MQIDKPETTQFECKCIEDQLKEARKSLGSIVHDFNNLLSVIGTLSYIMQQKAEKDSPIRIYIEHIDQAVKNGIDLIKGVQISAE